MGHRVGFDALQRLLSVSLLILGSACAPHGGVTTAPPPPPPPIDAPAPPPPPPPPTIRSFDVVLIVREGAPVVGATVTYARTDGAAVPEDQRRRVTDGSGFTHTHQREGRYRVEVAAPGYLTQVVDVDVDQARTVDVTLVRDRPRQVRGRLTARGRALTYPDGARFRWRGVTAFALLDQIADGREADAVAFLRWARDTGFNLARVLCMASGLFQLAPDDGQRALPRLLELAREHDVYVELVALADTRAYDMRRQDLRQQVVAIGAIAAAAEHALVQVANEHYHPTQVDALADVEFLNELGRLLPDEVLYTLSPAQDDEAGEPAGEYVTRHLDRGRDQWNQVRRVRELENVSTITNRFVVNDEAIGADEIDGAVTGRQRFADEHVFYAMGALSRGFEVGATFHCQSCLRAEILGPVQEACAQAFLAGVTLIPDDMAAVTFKNARWSDSPVKDARFSDDRQPNTTVRAYSFVVGARGWLVLVGVNGDPGVEFQHGWTVRGPPLVDRPGVRVLVIARN